MVVMLLLDGLVGRKPIPFDALAPLFQRHGDCYGHLIFDPGGQAVP